MASKVLLVEDDNNLREIYQARLQAEGYDIVSAKDGEEALVIAKQEQPDLIISDVMMPRVSGFEMLDILRNTEGLKDPKVIMLTALGQADDKNRAHQLGADRYLVKSQVTLEDIVKAAQDLLNGNPGETSFDAVTGTLADSTDNATTAGDPVPDPVDPPATTPPSADPQPEPEPVDPPATEPVAVETTTVSEAMPAPTAPGTEQVVTEPIEASPDEKDPNEQLIADALKDLTSATTNEPIVGVDTALVPDPVDPPATTPPSADPPSAPDPQPEPEPVDPPATEPVAVETTTAAPTPEPEPEIASDDDSSTVAHKKVISPISDPAAEAQPDINDLLAKEEAKDSTTGAPPAPQTTAPHASDVHTTAPEHQPGQVFSPSQDTPSPVSPVAAVQPAAAVNDETDPSRIAL